MLPISGDLKIQNYLFPLPLPALSLGSSIYKT